MELIFGEYDYDRLEVDPNYSHGLSVEVVARYRSQLQLLRAAHSERDLIAMECLRFGPLPRSRRHHSIYLGEQYRLVIELQKQVDGAAARILIVRIDEN
jgi:plasmid maintenance system killer protein